MGGNFSGKAYFIFGLLWLPAIANGLTLSRYIESFISNSESILNQKASVERAESDYEIANDLWATSLSLSPSYRNNVQTFESQTSSSVFEFDIENTGIEGGINQGLPWGLDFEVSAFKNLIDTQENFLGLEQQVSGTLFIDLFQNLGGVQDRARIEAAKKALEAEQLNLQDQLLRQCHSAIQTYANAKYALEQLKLVESQYEAAKRAFAIAEKSFRQRIIRRIDLLSAKSDLVSAESDLATQKATTQEALDELIVQGGETVREKLHGQENEELALESPATFLVAEFESQSQWDGSRQAKAVELLKQSADRNVEATRMAERAQVRAGVSTEIQESVTQFSDGATQALFDQRNETVRVFLEMEWPWNNSNAARVAAAKSDKTRAEAQALETRKQLQSEYLELVRQKQALKVQLRAREERTKVLEERMKNGLRLVKSGKLDFDEYIRYANAFFQESSQLVEARARLVANRLGFYNFTEKPVKPCEGLL